MSFLAERLKTWPTIFASWRADTPDPLPAWAAHMDEVWQEATALATAEGWTHFLRSAGATVDAIGSRWRSAVEERELARLEMRMAAARLHLGQVDAGREALLELVDTPWPAVATWVRSNLAAAENARGDHKAGLAHAREAIALDPSNPFGHLNALAAASMLQDGPSCEALAADFALHHPAVRDASTTLGGIVRSDPELTWFRERGGLARHFSHRRMGLQRVAGFLGATAVIVMVSGVGG